MININGYIYKKEEKAKKAVEVCNSYYLPNKKKTDSTLNWVFYSQGKLNNSNFFYIVHNKSLNEVLGEPKNFKIDSEDFL
jgi:hypothetical protein|tara:strand:+ start:390 stop:629 length:240 start_codon:yes stop_codon:yes gene_type:complete